MVRVNFGPTFIIKYDVAGVNPVSELQPMNPEDRVVSNRRFFILYNFMNCNVFLLIAIFGLLITLDPREKYTIYSSKS